MERTEKRWNDFCSRCNEYSDYSSFGIAINRKHAFKWLFHQEKATFHCAQKVYVNSETDLATQSQIIPWCTR